MWNWIKCLFVKDESIQTAYDIVLAYMKQHGSIDVDEAEAVGVKNLRSVICKLKRKGYKIKNTQPQGRKAVYKFK